MPTDFESLCESRYRKADFASRIESSIPRDQQQSKNSEPKEQASTRTSSNLDIDSHQPFPPTPQTSICSEQLFSDQHAALQARRLELQAQLLVLLHQAPSSQSPDSSLQLSKLRDVTLLLRVFQSQKSREE